MDLSKSQWSDFNVTDKDILSTNKMYFSRYFCRAEIFIPAAHLMRWINNKTYSKFVAEVERHRQYARDYIKKHQDSDWRWKGKNEVLTCSPAQLYAINSICEEYKLRGDIKTRIEGRAFQIYSTTEDVLLEVLHKFGGYRGLINEINLPVNQGAKDKLAENVIFMKNPKYSYRVTIRDATFSAATKEQILKYLSNYPFEVKLPPGLQRRLAKEDSSYLRGYFYLNDLTILTFLKMIAPNFVGKIFKLERIV